MSKMPDSHCCRCFAPEPAHKFTRRATRKKNAIASTRLSSTFIVPLCDDCYKHAQLRQKAETFAAIASVVLFMLLTYVFITYVQTNNLDVDTPVMAGGIVALVFVGMGIAYGFLYLLLGQDYMTIHIYNDQPAQVTFTSDDYAELHYNANK